MTSVPDDGERNTVTAADGTPVPTGARVTTQGLRRIAAHAVRLRLPLQLDVRLDTLLVPDGTHVLVLGALLDADPVTGSAFPEPVVRCSAMPHFLGVDSGDLFFIAVDVTLANYLACEPMPVDTLDPESAAAWHRYSTALRDNVHILSQRPHQRPHLQNGVQ